MEPNQDCHCPRVKHLHGTRTNYLIHACRCTPCRQDATRESDTMRRQKAYGRYTKTRVPAQPARNHIQELRKQGMGVATIAKTAGLSHTTISRILYGEPAQNRPPVPLINPETEAAILNTRVNYSPGHLVNATGTHRRIQALAAIGYPLRKQATMAGRHTEFIIRALQHQRIHQETATIVANLYDQYQLKPNKPGIARDRALKHARRNGWLPPLAWDDIDDPNHHGYPEAVAA